MKAENRYQEGQDNSHKFNDSKDSRSLMDRAKAEEMHPHEDEADAPKSKEEEVAKIDPTLPAKLHGNEPSKGAKIDAELQQEEEELLKKQGKA